MYTALSPHWAGTILGLVQVALIPIPFVFYKWGDRIRARSPLIRQMREDQEKSQKRAARAKKAAEKLEAARGGGVADVENDAAEETNEKGVETGVSEKV